MTAHSLRCCPAHERQACRGHGGSPPRPRRFGAAAVRELAEETGLVVAVEGLRLVSTSSTAYGENRWLAWNFTASVEAGDLVAADPDGEILEVGWFPSVEAVRLLNQLPYRPLKEPVVAHLGGGQVLGSHWRYDTPDVEAVVTAGPRD